ncbi:MAG: hypothetical protein M3463_01465 [Verrucomicrobiota bacterium]|nr:hypothetical protein [Verrucomicrobiota bacterium]
MRQSQQALDEYNRAQQLNPLHENSLFNKAGLYVEVMDDREKALLTAREFLSRFPNGGAAPGVRRLVANLEGEAAGGVARLDQRLLDWKAKPQHITFRSQQSDGGVLR